MKCISATLKNEWLVGQGFSLDLVRRIEARDFDLSFTVPPNFHQMIHLISESIGDAGRGRPILISVEDWPHYHEAELELVNVIRRYGGAEHCLIEAPNHLFAREESGLAIGLFVMTTGFCWKSTLYAPGADTVIHNWEGDYFDCWSCSKHCLLSLKRLAEEFSLEVQSG